MYCPNCGHQIQDSTKFCPKCGMPLAPTSAKPQPEPVPQPQPQPQPQSQPHYQPYQTQYQPQSETFIPIEENEAPNSMEKTLAIEAYLDTLCLFPLFGAKKSKFVRYHTNQGLILFAISFALTILISFNIIISVASESEAVRIIFASILNSIYGIAKFVVLIFSIIGIVNVVKGKMKPLPFIGKYKILK